MKRTRFSPRSRISPDATELARLASGLAESGSQLEAALWTNSLRERIITLLESAAEDELNAALDRLFDTQPTGHEALAAHIESCAESCTVTHAGQEFDVLLLNVPVLAWSRYSIPAGTIPQAILSAIETQLKTHILAADAQLGLADFLFSPDQLPRSFVATHELMRDLTRATLKQEKFLVDSARMQETNNFLADVRHLLGVVLVPRGKPLFRWNEKNGSRENALKEWIKQGAPKLEPLLTGCAYQPLLADAYHAACRQADIASRPYSLRASVAFLQTTLGTTAEALRVIIGSFYEQQLEEYRISFGPRDKDDVYHGVVWPLLGNEDEETEAVEEIETILRECGVKDIIFLDHHFPYEFCEDCGYPLYPNSEGEITHPELPETSNSPSQTLH